MTSWNHHMREKYATTGTLSNLSYYSYHLEEKSDLLAKEPTTKEARSTYDQSASCYGEGTYIRNVLHFLQNNGLILVDY
jgi:hexokinase